MGDYLEFLERAEGVIWDVAQTHLSEFEGDVDLVPDVDEAVIR